MQYTALICYLAAARTPLPSVRAALEYVLAGNGLYARGTRQGLSVTVQSLVKMKASIETHQHFGC